MSSFLSTLKGKVACILAGVMVVSCIVVYFFMNTMFRTQAVEEAKQEAYEHIDRAVQMFMVSTVRFHEEYAAATSDAERQQALDKWNPAIESVDLAVIHDFGKDKPRVRLIGDESIFGYKPLGNDSIKIETAFEREAAQQIAQQKVDRVERIQDDYFRVAMPLPSNAHAGCAECHGVSVSGNHILGSINAYIPLAGKYVEARNQTFTVVGFVVGILLFVLAIIYWFMNQSIVRPLGSISRVVHAISDGDLTQDTDVQQQDELGRLSSSLRQMRSHLQEVIQNIGQAADQVASSSEELSATSQTLANGASEQATSIEETNASIQQLNSSIEENNQNAEQSNQTTAKAAGEAEEGGKAVLDTVNAMKQIADRIRLVDDIAEQTNLLALNAAIEAARAGEMGKGFAVVASEVRKLAEQSQAAAKEISELSANSVERAEKAGELIEKVVPVIKEASQIVHGISVTCSKQLQESQGINGAIQQLDQLTQQNSATSEETASASEELSAQAQTLQEMVSRFKIEEAQMGSYVQSIKSLPSPGK
ncbi:HAMP domain-containing protein [bacterium]|nr:HAMP domain-containing protein [bacterium]